MNTSLIFLKHVVKSRLFLLQKSCSILTGPYHRRQFSERFDFQIGEVMLAAFDAKLGEARRQRSRVSEAFLEVRIIHRIGCLKLSKSLSPENSNGNDPARSRKLKTRLLR